MSPPQQLAHAGEAARHAHGFLERLLLDGKFYTLFSLLFGVGCALQLQRLQAAGHDGVRVYRRRMAVLLLIGFVHTMLIWDGDILMLYALLGFTLPWFARAQDRHLLAWSLLLVFAIPLAGQALSALIGYAAIRYLGEQHIRDCVQVCQAAKLQLPAPTPLPPAALAHQRPADTD